MAYYREESFFATVALALEAQTVDQLKPLVALLHTTERPTRKADLVAVIIRHLEGDGLEKLWSQLDELQKAAVAETLYAPDGRFHPDRFRAKYAKDPDWGTSDRWGYNRTPS